MISSFHAVFGLRHRDKSAKVIDYNDQVIRVREYLLFRGIPSPHVFLLCRFPTVMLWVTLLSEVHLRWYSSVASALPIPQACCAMCAVDFLFHSSPCVV